MTRLCSLVMKCKSRQASHALLHEIVIVFVMINIIHCLHKFPFETKPTTWPTVEIGGVYLYTEAFGSDEKY